MESFEELSRHFGITGTVQETMCDEFYRQGYLAGQAALAASPVPACRVVDRGFRWVSDAQHHVPQLVIEFEPVPANAPCDAKGWRDRDQLAAMLSAPTMLNGLTESAASVSAPAQQNQCDGCMAGMPLERGFHRDRHGELVQMCERGRYEAAPAQAVIAWVRQHPDGTLTDEILLNSFIDPVRKSSGAWLPLSLPARAPSVEAQAGLTDEQIITIGRRAMDKCFGAEAQHIYIAREVERAVLAALKEPQQ